MQWKTLVFLLLAAPMMAGAQNKPVLQNWFNDPFFQVRDGIPDCPVPLGPLLSEAQMKSESHHRAERGTTCWLAGKCSEPNAYRYDSRIARSVQDYFNSSDAFKDASLWITVKSRFIWVEGCAGRSTAPGTLEALMKSMPDVERVIVNVMQGVHGKPPYPMSQGSPQ